MKKGLLIAGGILVIIAATSPYFCGNSMEDKFNNKVAELQNTLKSNPKITFEKTEYIKGWFSSSAKTVLKVNGRPLVMEHKVVHGPWGYFGLGKVETTFEVNEEKRPNNTGELFAGKEPLTITTNVGFSGYDSIEIYSPTITKQPLSTGPNTNISWGGMKGNLKFVGDRVISDLKLPEFRIENNNESFLIQNVNVTGDGIYLFNNLPDVVSKNWTGSSTMSVDKFSITNRDNEYSSAINVLVNTKDEDTGTVDYEANLKLTNLNLPAELGIVGSANDLVEFSINFSGVPKKQLAELIAYIEKLQKDGRTPSQMEVALMGQSLATELLKGTPSIRVYSQVGGNKGKATIMAEAKLITADSTNDLRSLLWGVVNRLVITITPSFSETLLDEAIATGQIPMSKDEFIQAITKNNRFTLNNGEYTGKFEYKQGRFYSNGRQDNELQSFLLQLKNFDLLSF